eukprot:5837704-Prymnesium_polylepis.1
MSARGSCAMTVPAGLWSSKRTYAVVSAASHVCSTTPSWLSGSSSMCMVPSAAPEPTSCMLSCANGMSSPADAQPPRRRYRKRSAMPDSPSAASAVPIMAPSRSTKYCNGVDGARPRRRCSTRRADARMTDVDGPRQRPTDSRASSWTPQNATRCTSAANSRVRRPMWVSAGLAATVFSVPVSRDSSLRSHSSEPRPVARTAVCGRDLGSHSWSPPTKPTAHVRWGCAARRSRPPSTGFGRALPTSGRSIE